MSYSGGMRILAVTLLLVSCAEAGDSKPSCPNCDCDGGGPAAGDPTAGDAGAGDPGAGDPSAGDPTPASGALSFLSYNVAGLPQGISGSNPLFNTPLMSPLLNHYYVAVVQEDFAYHNELIADAQHPYQSEPMFTDGASFGDGLNRFSLFPFNDHTRVTWTFCAGIIDGNNDCLTPKGFSVATHVLADGVEVDVYNSHWDSGRDAPDAAARELQLDQFLGYVRNWSSGRAVILAGDTNMKESDEATVQRLLNEGGFVDACRALDCSDPGLHDRVLVRSSDAVTLTPVSWELDARFIDLLDQPLSDHDALGVTIEWSQR